DYFFCGDARQVGTHKFATNDSRMLGAFIENDKIQYVHNSMDTSTTWCSIYHGIISNVSTSPVVNGMLITDTLRDFGYPNISYAGVSGTDNSAIIHFDHCAPSVHAGVSAVKTDGNFNYSNTKKIVDGTSYVNVLGGPQERWGDYSGSQRKYNVPGEVWVSGYMGYASGVNRVHRAYIAQLSTNPTLSTTAPITAEETTTHVFPNPFENMISVDFDMEKREYLTFDITDMTGKRVHLLMREYVKAGKDRFSFSIEDLAPGMYMFNITAKDRVISSTKIVRK
ncbi:MAG TPA: T9SS type A sorting domain-containing protein, partial [Flavobacteriales bacterium]|nr:T9SS type A sorting domain-containing protein [Flavobacteriales bacterium]